MTNIFDDDFQSNDFVIRLRPRMLEGKWDGDVDIGIMWDGTHKLTHDDFHKLMHLTKMVCASVPIMEYDEDLRNDINNYVLDTENDMQPMSTNKTTEKVTAQVTEVDGNVIKLSFNTSTKGTA
tara:strand:+ start:6876 stop:7244 length:369 start_codon:yes stop_codon:yes gene_type:complete